VLAGDGGAGRDELGGSPREDDAAAVVPGAGTEVDDPVGVHASPAPKNCCASVTDMASTSLMSRPASWCSSTDAWNLFPSHSSQTVATPAIIARSV
jgi:hypothetical protein